MKKSFKLIQSAALMALCLCTTSCATMFSGQKTEVVLVNPPGDLKVYEDGKELPVEKVMAQVKSKGIGDGQQITTYYASGVFVNKKQKRHKLTLESGGKKGDVNLTSKVNGGMLFLDIVFTGGVGVIVDGATKKWRKIKSNHVDVPAIIAGTQPQSNRKLKKIIRKQARENS
jgi:hypothetical protein